MDLENETQPTKDSIDEFFSWTIKKADHRAISTVKSSGVIAKKAVLVFNRHYVDAHFCYKELTIQLAKNGYQVDLYYLKGDQEAHFDPSLDIRVYRFGQSATELFSFLFRLSGSLFKAHLVVATPQYALHWVYQLKWWSRARFVCLSDEVYTDDYSGYSAEQKLLAEFQAKWRKREIKAHQACDATIALGLDRYNLVREVNQLNELHKVFIVPNAPSGTRQDSGEASNYYRNTFKLTRDQLIVLHSGGLKWDLMDDLFTLPIKDPKIKVLIQARINHRNIRDQLSDSILLSENFFPYEDMVSLTRGADIGLLLYSQENPEERRNGPTAGKLGLYLAAGLPLIACNLSSFEWIEDEGCGVLIQHLDQLEEAVNQIKTRYGYYQENAKRVFKSGYEYTKMIQPFIEWTANG
ncbi:MAG: hypothetical protein KI791_14785 [Cyclobacteriaceae bacterium]|nr:hypothetical protein [Cyclobacteriaceae bacterium SS2]